MGSRVPRKGPGGPTEGTAGVGRPSRKNERGLETLLEGGRGQEPLTKVQEVLLEVQEG